MGLWFRACAAQLRRDVPAMLDLGRRAMALMATRDALPGAGPHNVSLGWARVMASDGAERADGLAQLELGIAHYERQGSLMGMSWHRAAQAEAHLAAGDLATARRHADTAMALGLSTPVSFMLAYVLHIDAKVRWAEGGGLPAAQAAWERAIDHARQTEAPLLGLIASGGLAEALAAAGQVVEARQRLQTALAPLTAVAGGAACPAMEQARTLMAALSG
jgi:tetratricopeptide (TPR) repeat protein